MHPKLGPAYSVHLSQVEEDHIWTEVEDLVDNGFPATVKRADVTTTRGVVRYRWRLPLVLFAALVLVAVIVPASLKNDLLALVTHQSAGE